LKPSQASLLENANLIFWAGHELEAFLEKPVTTIGEKAKSIELIDTPDLRKLAPREGGAFEEHDPIHHHGEEHEEGHETDHDEHHEEVDLHFWLDPENAKVLTNRIAGTLIAADPENASRYEANARSTLSKLDALTSETSAMLAPFEGRGFIVFHDAYQYFETRFNLAATGSITTNPEVMPGAERVREIRDKVSRTKTECVFSEPQFTPKLIAVVTEGTDTRSGVLDPLGATLEDGPELYFNLIRNMARSIRDCLSRPE
jgi:zinc transport system substrate-binding protein